MVTGFAVQFDYITGTLTLPQNKVLWMSLTQNPVYDIIIRAKSIY